MRSYCTIILLFIVTYALADDSLSADYVQAECPGSKIRVIPYGEDSLRFQISPKAFREGLPGALNGSRKGENVQVDDLDSPSPTNVTFPIRRPIRVSHGNIVAIIGIDGLITVKRKSDSKVLLKEITRQYAPSPFLNDTYIWNVTYASDAQEEMYGLGEHPKNGRLNNKGATYVFKEALDYDISYGTQVLIPYYVSNRGYGYLWNLPSFGIFKSTETTTSWSSESAYQLDFWITTTARGSVNPYGDIMKRYYNATGTSPKLPRVASGFIQSNNRYRNQTAVLDVARGHVARGIPISMIVIDRIRTDTFGDFSFSTAICWPDPVSMNEELESLGIKSIVSVWPLVQINSRNVAEFLPYVIKCPDTLDFCVQPPLPVYTYDATIPAARQLIWNKVKEGLFDKGTHSFFLDSTEPAQFSTDPRYFYSIGPQETVGMYWVVDHIRAFRENQVAVGVGDDAVNIARSAWAGAQKFAPIIWSGDVNSTFESLSQQVRVGLNMGLSGMIYWTTDIGGYMGGDITTPYWRELAIRWFQYGAFCPIFRSHGFRNPLQATDADICMRSGASNEIWNFGDEAYQAIKTIILIREQLRPYVQKHLDIAAATGTPIMRPLFFDYPNDAESYKHDDQFMFGPKYLVAPVLEYGARSRSVYFPPATNAVWVHWFTHDTYTPGTTVVVDAPINTFPLFKKQKICSNSNNSTSTKASRSAVVDLKF